MSEVLDALVITTCGYAESPPETQDNVTPENLDLDGVVAFERLDPDVAEKLMDACETRGFKPLPSHLAQELFEVCEIRGFGYPPPRRQYGQRISIVRRSPPNSDKREWDPDRAIYKVLALSRLVHPIPVGVRYSGRVWLSTDRQVKEIVPGPVHGRMAYAFCARERRWYLKNEEAQRIKELLPKDTRQKFPERVCRALWRFDYVFYEYYTDLRWLDLSAAMEALVHTDPYKSTAQFAGRVAALADEIGISGWSEQRLRNLYHEYRCAVAHGQEIRKAEPADIREYVDFEDLVRAILLRCIEDPRFRRLFSTDQGIRSKWAI